VASKLTSEGVGVQSRAPSRTASLEGHYCGKPCGCAYRARSQILDGEKAWPPLHVHPSQPLPLRNSVLNECHDVGRMASFLIKVSSVCRVEGFNPSNPRQISKVSSVLFTD